MSHSENILHHLKHIGPLTAKEAARKYGCMRLAARIEELRHDYDIETETVRRRNRNGRVVSYARYHLQ